MPDKKKEEFQPAQRVNKALTAEAEKKLLIWIAKRIPRSLVSDHFTIFAIVMSAFAGFSFYMTTYSPWWFIGASIGIISNWFGDSLDGTIARVRDLRRERYGFYLDHICDMVSTFFIGLGAYFSPYVIDIFGLLLVVVYFLLAMHSFMATIVNSTFKLSFGKIGPTEFRLFVIIACLISIPLADTTFEIVSISFTFMDLALLGGVVGLAGAFLSSLIKTIIQLNRLDPMPPSKPV